MNLTIMSGRLTKDCDVKAASNGMYIGRFTLAVDRAKKEGQEQTADFINCVCFGKTAEAASKYFKKGTKLLVRGHWQSGSYEGKDGNKVYTNDNVVDTWEFAESKSDKPTGMSAINATVEVEEPGWMNVTADEELPFAQPSR